MVRTAGAVKSRTAGVLAIDVSAEMIRAVVIDREGTTHSSKDAAAPVGQGDANAVAAIRKLADATARGAGRVDLVGGCVVVPGIVDSALGVARYSAEYGWHNLPLARLLHDDLGVSVGLEQTVRAAAVAEGSRGSARGLRNWLYLFVGNTIAAGAFVDGRLQRGATGAAGEFGHLPIYPFGELCACGQRGCVEVYASVASVTARYERISGDALTIAQIAERAGRHPLAGEVWTNAIEALGSALVMYTMIEDPELVVLGGELARVADPALAALSALRGDLRKRLLWRQAPRVVIAELGHDAPLLGAIELAWAEADRAALVRDVG
jgi:glucokinase